MTTSFQHASISNGNATRFVPRAHYRRSSGKPAYAVFMDQFCILPCVISNISHAGARLIFKSDVTIPSEFFLHVEEAGYKVRCHPIWSAGVECGVRFIGERLNVKPKRSPATITYDDVVQSEKMQ